MPEQTDEGGCLLPAKNEEPLRDLNCKRAFLHSRQAGLGSLVWAWQKREAAEAPEDQWWGESCPKVKEENLAGAWRYMRERKIHSCLVAAQQKPGTDQKGEERRSWRSQRWLEFAAWGKDWWLCFSCQDNKPKWQPEKLQSLSGILPLLVMQRRADLLPLKEYNLLLCLSPEMTHPQLYLNAVKLQTCFRNMYFSALIETNICNS